MRGLRAGTARHSAHPLAVWAKAFGRVIFRVGEQETQTAFTLITGRVVDYIPWIHGHASLMLRGMDDQRFKHLRDRLATDMKALRLNAGLSQEALALAAEVDRTYVSQLERGIANPSLLILHRISEVLGTELRISFGDGGSTRSE